MRRDLQSMLFPVPPVDASTYRGAEVVRAGEHPPAPGEYPRGAGDEPSRTGEDPSYAVVVAPGHDSGRLPLWVLVVLGVGAGAVLGAAVWAATHLQADPVLHTGALFVHLIALVVSFGAVIAVDWFALLWLLGHRSLTDLTKVSAAAHLPIWLGLLGLVLSGALLRPDLAQSLTWLKLGLVLLVTLNGLHALALEGRLARFQTGTVPYRLLRRAMAAAAVSQLGWWGATIIGFLNVQR